MIDETAAVDVRAAHATIDQPPKRGNSILLSLVAGPICLCLGVFLTTLSSNALHGYSKPLGIALIVIGSICLLRILLLILLVLITAFLFRKAAKDLFDAAKALSSAIRLMFGTRR